jgi:cytochrome-b5 reductase
MNPQENIQIKEPSSKSTPQVRVRQKIPIAPGYSLRDWYRIKAENEFQSERVHTLAKTANSNRGIPLSEVKKHNTLEDCWTVIRGKVYDITAYIKFHPGGVEKIMIGAGRDMTSLFDKYHQWVNYETLLDKCYLGVIQTDMQAMIFSKKASGFNDLR